MLMDYKEGEVFNTYFSEKTLEGGVPVMLEGQDSWWYLYVDQSNNKVIVDTSAGEYGWQGELEIEEYLQHIVDGNLCQKECEIKCERYSKENCDCSECS